MSGPKKEVTAGETSHGDSSPRHKAAPIQGQEFGEQLSTFRALSARGNEYFLHTGAGNLGEFSLPQATVERLSESREAYQGWINSLAETLSEEGRALIGTPFFQHLRSVPHSTVSHSRLFNHVDLTRWDHCIHAAHSVNALGAGGRLGLTPYEMKVLELVLLLHDPHRLGSHALDRVFASMPGSPKDFNSWWPKNDYHEYHGAVAAAQDPAIRTILGKYYDDVMAILTRDDRRPLSERARDYGELHPHLSDARLASLKCLEDELDRCSYLKLDYLRSGFAPSLIVKAISDVERHEQTLTAHGAGIQLNIGEQHMGARPFDDVARRRSFYRAELATLPVGCLVEEAIFQNGVWDKARGESSPNYLKSAKFYEDVRDRALQGRYAEIFSEDALNLLEGAHSDNKLCVEDVYAPIVTMTLADITDDGGMCQLGGYLPPGVAEGYCGVPRRDMTQFEGRLRQALSRAKLDPDIHILTSNDFGKTFEYDVCRHGKPPVREVSETPCHKSLIKVIIAARAIDKAGNTIDLSNVKNTIHDFLSKSGLLQNPDVLNYLNPRVFCDPVTPGYFSDSVRANIAAFTPEWIKRGGCGLL